MSGKGRILAIDYGEKNVGLACCDELGLTVHPLPSMPNRGISDLLKKLQALVDLLDIHRLVMGIPFRLDGTQGDAARRMEQLRGKIANDLGIPVLGIDESLSSMEASELWREMSKKQQRKYRTADSLAAALILERHLKES